MAYRLIGQESLEIATASRSSTSLGKLSELVDWGQIAALLEPLLEATQYMPFNADTTWSPDWPGNILSKRIVIYGDGTIARQGDSVWFAVEPSELALCRRMAAVLPIQFFRIRKSGTSAAKNLGIFASQP